MRGPGSNLYIRKSAEPGAIVKWICFYSDPGEREKTTPDQKKRDRRKKSFFALLENQTSQTHSSKASKR
jgi:hypothetical protein